MNDYLELIIYRWRLSGSLVEDAIVILKYVCIIMILLILATNSVSAVYNPWAYNTKTNPNLVTKDLLDIDNCFNLTVQYTLTSGNTTPVSFPGCSDKGNNTWYCDCKNTVGEYTLKMNTDGAELKKDRRYSMSVEYYTYELNEESATFKVVDSGPSADISGKNLEDLGKVVEYIETPIFINRTVYVDKIINNVTTVYVDKPRDVYVENITRITELNNTLTETLKDLEKAENVNKWIIIAIIVIILIVGLLFILWEN